MDWSFFNVEEYLQDRGIEYAEGGTKNVASGWVGIKCPFCDDTSTHMGINLTTKGVRCWKCGQPRKGGLAGLISKLENIPIRKSFSTIENFIRHTDTRFDERSLSLDAEIRSNDRAKMPFEIKKTLSDESRAFLRGRGLDDELIASKYKLMETGVVGNWKFRLIIPVFMGHRMVSYIGRDYTGKAPIPYLNCPNNNSVIPIKHCLYNFDSVRGRAIVVEGVIDVWKMGDGTVGTFGTEWTREQMRLLSTLDRVFVLYDNEEEAQRKASDLAYELGMVVPEVEILRLTTAKDTGEMSNKDIFQLKREIFGNANI